MNNDIKQNEAQEILNYYGEQLTRIRAINKNIEDQIENVSIQTAKLKGQRNMFLITVIALVVTLVFQ